MRTEPGMLGDDHELSARARTYANDVLQGSDWPLGPEHVTIDRVTFETSTRLKRKHGVCCGNDDGHCTVRLAERAYQRVGFEALRDTIRHELVHVYQYQTPGIEPGHGDSFVRWVDPLELAGRCRHLYEHRPSDYTYRLYCTDSCGFVDGRHRRCPAIGRALRGELVCGRCESRLRVETDDGRLTRSEWSG